ncbi:MAG: maleylpyruvate isomerase family mycothiol-dependent enzyme [Nocardioides sp.]
MSGAEHDAERLTGYVGVWWQAIDDFTTLLERLDESAWSRPTDLPGWDVRAVAAHIAHLESLAAGGQHDEVEIGEPAHVRGPMGTFTEQGVVARRDRSPDELINEIRSSATTRHTALLADPPTDPAATAPGLFGMIGWSTETLLRNRPLDVWMHEQDVRRAVGRPGNLDGPAGVHAADYLAESLGFVLAKKAGAPAGATAVLEIDGHAPYACRVTDQNRGERLADPPAEPTTRLAMSRGTFIELAGGRRAPGDGAVRIEGDADLGQRIVAALAVTP